MNPLRFEEEDEAASDGLNHGTAGGYVDEEEVNLLPSCGQNYISCRVILVI